MPKPQLRRFLTDAEHMIFMKTGKKSAVQHVKSLGLSVRPDRGLSGGVLLRRVLSHDGLPAVRHHAEPGRGRLHVRCPHRRRHCRYVNRTTREMINKDIIVIF